MCRSLALTVTSNVTVERKAGKSEEIAQESRYWGEKRAWYWYRERFNRLVAYGHIDSQEAAELFYCLNRTGYNGLCRFNRKGLFNTPYGRHPTIHYTTDFSAYRTVLAYWTLRSGDFAELSLQPDDFVYADPPYDVAFTQYSQDGFTWADQERLAVWLTRHPGPVAASNKNI